MAKSESFLQMIFSLAELLIFGITSNPGNRISQRNHHSKNTCEVDVGGLEDILEESPEEDAVLVQHLFGTFHTVAHVRMVLLTFVPETGIR